MFDISRALFEGRKKADEGDGSDNNAASGAASPWGRHVLPGTGDRKPTNHIERPEFKHWRGLLPAGKASQIDFLPDAYRDRAKTLVEFFGQSGVSFGDFRITPSEAAVAIGTLVDTARNLLVHMANHGIMVAETTHSQNMGYATSYRWRS